MVETIEETRVTTETVELYVCPICEQGYEPGQLVSVGLGVESDQSTVRSVGEFSVVCANCATAVFDYEGPEGRVPEADVAVETTTRDDSTRDDTELTIAGSLVGWILGAILIASLEPSTGPAADAIGYVGLVLLLVTSVTVPGGILYSIRTEFPTHRYVPYLYAVPLLAAIWFVNLLVVPLYLLFRRSQVTS